MLYVLWDVISVQKTSTAGANSPRGVLCSVSAVVPKVCNFQMDSPKISVMFLVSVMRR
jgi:hypothetical protein